MKTIDKVVEKLYSTVKDDKNIDIKILKKSVNLAIDAHKGQLRESGEPFIIHPLHVAILIAQLKMDTASIVCAVLHDVIEDTSVTLETIEKTFGSVISQMISGLTKLNKIEVNNRSYCEEQEKIENYRNLMCAVSKDFRVIIIKLADRLHNMQTLHFINSKEKRLRIARETMDIHASLAERIGLHKYKNELQELAFEELYRNEKKEIDLQMKKLRSELGSSVKKIVEQIKETIDKENVQSLDVSGREKQLCSIWRKLYNKKIIFEDLTDIFAFRIVVNTTDECYKALFAIHKAYHMVPGEFKDYISTPKTNGYQSLHTVIIGPEKKRIEIQIRTESMHKIAEYGIAAHWQYKEQISNNESLKNFSWISEFLGILEHTSNPSEILQDSKLEIHYHQVFSFTQNGHLIALPDGSTALDFAFYENPEKALKCKEIIINKVSVPFHYKIQNGEQIFIKYGSKNLASKLWLSFLNTGKAKQTLQNFFRNNDSNLEVEKGENLLRKIFLEHNIPFSQKIITQNIKQFYNIDDIDEFYRKISSHLINLNDFLKKSDLNTKKSRFSLNNPFVKKKKINHDKFNYFLSTCCFPVRDDKSCYWIEDNNNVVHRKKCRRINLRANQNIKNFNWNDFLQDLFQTKIIISFRNKPGAINQVLTYIANKNINIREISAQQKYAEYAECSMILDVKDLHQLEMTLNGIRRINSVHDVIRMIE